MTLAFPETARAPLSTPVGRAPRLTMPPVLVQRKARAPPTPLPDPTIVLPPPDMEYGWLTLPLGMTPMSTMPPAAVHRKARGPEGVASLKPVMMLPSKLHAWATLKLALCRRPRFCIPVALVQRKAYVVPDVVQEPTTVNPSAETAAADALTPLGSSPRSCIPPARVQRKARDPETPTMTDPLEEMPLAELEGCEGRTPRSW